MLNRMRQCNRKTKLFYLCFALLILAPFIYLWHTNAHMAEDFSMKLRINFATMNDEFDYSTDENIKTTLYLPIATYGNKPKIDIVEEIIEQHREKYGRIVTSGIAEEIQIVKLVDTEYGPMLKYQTNYRVSHFDEAIDLKMRLYPSKIGMCPFLGVSEIEIETPFEKLRLVESLLYADFNDADLELQYGVGFGHDYKGPGYYVLYYTIRLANLPQYLDMKLAVIMVMAVLV